MRNNDTVERYRLLTLVGKGQSGEVWSAFDTKGGGLFALKIFNENEKSALLARHEYGMASAFDHPCILRPIRLCELPDMQAIVMPLCGGRSVDGVAGFMDEDTIWSLIHDISSALACVHEEGCVHADVKPSNILWTGTQFMLADFSSCRRLAEGGDSPDVADDKSSFHYQAPEAVAHRCETASDVWSLGATVFHLFMGSLVFNGFGGRAQLPQSPVPFMRKEHAELSDLVCRCLSFNPADRPSASQIAKAAEEHLAGLTRRPTVRPRKPKETGALTDSPSDFWPEEMID